MSTVLITGGAGFIGSHLADELLASGYRVRALDNIDPQVHGDVLRPAYLSEDVELLRGDVRDEAAVRRALKGVDRVVHFAASVGVGQSMYEVAEYTAVNNLGTAVLLEALIEQPVEKLVVASSMSLYGEGLYRDADGTSREPSPRGRAQFERKDWELLDGDGEPLTPIPTPETKTPDPTSVYALSKYDQERLCLMIGAAYDIPTTALRFFNVYGTRQALSNPYTGVLAIFASRFLNDNPPMIFEDGYQQRDFVSVRDVARGVRLALERPAADGEVFNIGGGRAYTIREIAARMAGVLGKEHLIPEVTETYRVGDIRHCFADISKAKRLLGYEPEVEFDDGLTELADWLDGQTADDRVGQASAELAERGLTV
jgi:dTDP-L-rhamnose 4-epimerase